MSSRAVETGGLDPLHQRWLAAGRVAEDTPPSCLGSDVGRLSRSTTQTSIATRPTIGGGVPSISRKRLLPSDTHDPLRVTADDERDRRVRRGTVRVAVRHGLAGPQPLRGEDAPVSRITGRVSRGHRMPAGVAPRRFADLGPRVGDDRIETLRGQRPRPRRSVDQRGPSASCRHPDGEHPGARQRRDVVSASPPPCRPRAARVPGLREIDRRGPGAPGRLAVTCSTLASGTSQLLCGAPVDWWNRNAFGAPGHVSPSRPAFVICSAAPAASTSDRSSSVRGRHRLSTASGPRIVVDMLWSAGLRNVGFQDYIDYDFAILTAGRACDVHDPSGLESAVSAVLLSGLPATSSRTRSNSTASSRSTSTASGSSSRRATRRRCGSSRERHGTSSRRSRSVRPARASIVITRRTSQDWDRVPPRPARRAANC